MATVQDSLFINTLVGDAVSLPVDALGCAQQGGCRDLQSGPGRDN